MDLQTSKAQDDLKLLQIILEKEESLIFECKRPGKVDKLLESVVAFANTEGGIIAYGLEDPDKASGTDRVYGVQDHQDNWDEILRKIATRITETEQIEWSHHSITCVTRENKTGFIILIKIKKSSRVHSILENGTFIRLSKGNRELVANEINDLCYARGVISAESQLVDVDFHLLNTSFWMDYASHRQLTRPIKDAMFHAGLAKKDRDGELKPTKSAVLLFAENPSALLGSKASIRIFHYRGNEIETDPNTNLIKPPMTISGPLIRLIQLARQAVINELASGIQITPLGFEIIQQYPVRVITEAITNAVIHRDYRLPSDIVIRIFANRILIESPGLFAGPVNTNNIRQIGTYARNIQITQNLREFPTPPNLDAGEGVPMMFGMMHKAGLYPPIYQTRPKIPREAVVVTLFNENRLSIWSQVEQFIQQHGSVANAEVRKLMNTDDTLRVSKQFKIWVAQGLLVVSNPTAGRNVRRYCFPQGDNSDLFFSNHDGKEDLENP